VEVVIVIVVVLFIILLILILFFALQSYFTTVAGLLDMGLGGVDRGI